MKPELRQRISMLNPVHFLGLGFGSGLIPVMPGTFGSLAAIPVLLLMQPLPLWGFWTVTVLACAVGVYLCGKTARDMQVHDHGSIVWDEIAGMMITFLFVPISWLSLIAGFVLFRLFDILKPWPINVIDQRVHGGTGIMLDDILAGAMAALCLALIHQIFPF